MAAVEEANHTEQLHEANGSTDRAAEEALMHRMSSDDPSSVADEDHESGENAGDGSSDSRDQDVAADCSSGSKDKKKEKEEKKQQKALEKARKKEEKDQKKSTGRLRMDGMIDKAIRMFCPITGEGKRTINAKIKDQRIPSTLIRSAKGLAFLTIAKSGLVIGVQAGLGIVIGRKPDGKWSPPCAFRTGGLSCGVLIGASVVDLLLVINTEEQLKVLTSSGMVKLGADLEVSVGPVGRNAQASVAAGNKGVAGCYAYSFSKGMFGGVSLDGVMLVPNDTENARFYGQPVKPKDIFVGDVPVPEGRPQHLIELFNLTLEKVAERTTRRASAMRNGSGTASGSDLYSDEASEEQELPEALINYFKERGE
eukprot:GGOE01005328.1.p1 GENE.GGOE01005328.1~~GGOE01005328.1.p1  ORF type:complete len:384 (-),score=131.42 GGOE01005328.1:665-1765(-)